LEAGEFVHTLGDAHIYLNHLEQTNLLLSREARNLPQIRLNSDKKSVFEFDYQDIQLLNYHPLPAIKAPISV
jgi:thymidylate synthase